MSEYKIQEETLTGLADAVRQLNGTSGQLSPSDMINGIEGHVCPNPTINPLSVTENGTYTAPSGVDGYSPVTVNVSGGGGASNVVTGEFMYSAYGAKNVDIPYDGNGYPVAVLIFPKGGMINSGLNPEWYNASHEYALGMWSMIKAKQTDAPTYSGSKKVENRGFISTVYKPTSSTLTFGTLDDAASDTGSDVYKDTAATKTDYVTAVRIKNNKTLSVYVANDTGVGFLKNVYYTFFIIYSS